MVFADFFDHTHGLPSRASPGMRPASRMEASDDPGQPGRARPFPAASDTVGTGLESGDWNRERVQLLQQIQVWFSHQGLTHIQGLTCFMDADLESMEATNYLGESSRHQTIECVQLLQQIQVGYAGPDMASSSQSQTHHLDARSEHQNDLGLDATP